MSILRKPAFELAARRGVRSPILSLLVAALPWWCAARAHGQQPSAPPAPSTTGAPRPDVPPTGPAQTAAPQAATPQAATPQTAVPAPAASPRPGSLRLIDIGLHVVGAVGGSSERDDVLLELQGGAHDPRQRGFTLQQAELSLLGAIDPWLDGRAFLVAAIEPGTGETIVELEEAFVQTRALPADLQVRAGTYFTEFGRMNATHPHAWDWVDQPLMASRLFGGDGMRGPGARVAWRPGPFELLLGAQNAHGETMASFLANAEVYEERAPGGRAFAAPAVRSAGDLVWTVRAAAAFAHGESELEFGGSAAFGPNASGDDGDTLLYGADFAWRWRGPDCAHEDHAHAHGHEPARLELQGELLGRVFTADEQVDASDPLAPVVLPRTRLRDLGGYLQALVGLGGGLAAGVRGEYATGGGASYRGGGVFARDEDPWRAERLRVSPLLSWRLSEGARLRLQYSFDDSDHLGRDAHTVWLGFDVLLGALPPHRH